MEDKIVVIHQPDFIPYLGFFHRLMLSDVYIVLDNVQFISGSSNCWTNRDKIKGPQGEKWITIPVKKCLLGTNISEVLINNDIDWKTRNLNLIKEYYKKAEGYQEIFPYIERLHKPHYNRLIEITMASIKMLIDLLDIKTEILYSSELNPSGKSNERVADLVLKAGAHRYLSGIGAREYFNFDVYDTLGIEVIWQDFKAPVYPQLYGEFIPQLSSIDLLLNCGIKKSREIIRGVEK